MNVAQLYADLRQRDITLTVDGNQLRVDAPKGRVTADLLITLREHKSELLRLLTEAPQRWIPPPTNRISDMPCPPPVVLETHGRSQVAVGCAESVSSGAGPLAIKVASEVLEGEVWVVADDLPLEQWPTDAPVYTHREVQMLRSLGRDVLVAVHMVKQVFAAAIVSSTRRVLPGSHGEEGQREQTKGVDGKREKEDA